MKINLFLDCEFNGFGGELISMALVSEHGDEFYEVLELPEDIEIHPWVKQNVMPILNKKPVDRFVFQRKLQQFLYELTNVYGIDVEVHIIVDWPDDIKYFCQSLITGAGTMMTIPSTLTMEIDRSLSNDKSEILHNALADARAIMQSWKDK